MTGEHWLDLALAVGMCAAWLEAFMLRRALRRLQAHNRILNARINADNLIYGGANVQSAQSFKGENGQAH